MRSVSSLAVGLYGMRWVALPPLVGASMLAMIIGAVIVAPREAVEGEVQRLMYIHVPSAIAMYVAFFVVFVAGIAYLRTFRSLWRLRHRRDRRARGHPGGRRHPEPGDRRGRGARHGLLRACDRYRALSAG